MKKNTTLLRAIAFCLAMCLFLSACNGKGGGNATYTVQVQDPAGAGVANVGIYIYADSTMEQLVHFDTTNADGVMKFTAPASDSYVAKLTDVPEEYSCEAYYSLTGENTKIVLGASQISGGEDGVFELGDEMMDFTVIGPDSTEYQLSKLLQEKRAVVLNFWYINCAPCKAEFPFLQKAYDKYKDAVAVLAINPVDNSEAVAKFQKEMGLTFPMMAGDPAWQKLMNITGFPTTVVIDRFGNIALKHMGGIEDAHTFEEIFAFFSDADYEKTVVESLDQLKELSNLGTAENPQDIGGVLSFEITVQPGEEYYVNLYKVKNMYMQLKDADAYVVYGDKKYEPKNGVVALTVTAPDNYTPAQLRFGNTSSEPKTFKVTLTPPAGSSDNPYTLKLGETTVKVNSGNDQGVHYVYRATETGTLKLECISASVSQYDCILQRVTASNVVVIRSLQEDGADKAVSVQVKKGEQVKIIFTTMPDEKFQYPGGTFVYNATFEAGEVDDVEQEEQLEYTVTVTDDSNNPVGNVNITLDVDGTPTYIATNAEGVAMVKLPKGTYLATVTVPGGYTLEQTEYTLSEETPNISVVLTVKKIVKLDYTVKVENVYAEAMADVLVIIGTQFTTTNEDGFAIINLEKGEYTVSVVAPEGYVTPEVTAFAADSSEMTVTLEYIPGTENAPIDVNANPFTTEGIAAGERVYYNLWNASGMILTIADPNAYVIYNEITYGADSTNTVRVPLEKTAMPMMPITIALGNNATVEKPFTMNLEYPLGHRMNPKILASLGQFTTNLPEGSEEGYFYLWTANAPGTFNLSTVSATEGAAYDVSITNLTNSANRTLAEDGVEAAGVKTLSLEVQAGDQVQIQVVSVPFDENGDYVGLPAAQIVLNGQFTDDESVEKITYTVEVYDEFLFPAFGMEVQFVSNGINVGSPIPLDDSGIAQVELPAGDYTVQLIMPDNYYTYDQATAVVSAAKPSVGIMIYENPDAMQNYTVQVTKDGALYTGTVTIRIRDKDNFLAASKKVTNGMMTTTLMKATYTVELVLTDPELEYQKAVLTETINSVTIELKEKAEEVVDVAHTVTVVNAKGQPQSGIVVQILQGTSVKYTGTTNASGEIAKVLPSAKYQVNLMFSGTSYYYNKEAAVLTKDKPNLTIVLADELSETDKISGGWFINDEMIYQLKPGTTHVQVGADKPYYSAPNGGNCFFVFTPDQVGKYKVYLDNPAVELYMYGMLINPFQQEAASDNADRALHYNILESQVGAVNCVIGIQVVEGITDVAITIIREGDLELDMHTAPWTEYTPVHTPSPFTLKVPTGKTLTYVDITEKDTSKYQAVYNEEDGFYHLGAADGPILYINLKNDAPYVTFNKMINGDGPMGGAPLRAYFFDSNGTFVKKEDYTNLMNLYIAAADETTGVYPVTKDIAYMVQNACSGWWTEDSNNYIMGGANPDLGWLFACCFIN